MRDLPACKSLWGGGRLLRVPWRFPWEEGSEIKQENLYLNIRKCFLSHRCIILGNSLLRHRMRTWLLKMNLVSLWVQGEMCLRAVKIRTVPALLPLFHYVGIIQRMFLGALFIPRTSRYLVLLGWEGDGPFLWSSVPNCFTLQDSWMALFSHVSGLSGEADEQEEAGWAHQGSWTSYTVSHRTAPEFLVGMMDM